MKRNSCTRIPAEDIRTILHSLKRKAETYDPGATLAFEETQVGVLEVVQEEVNNIDPQEVQKAVIRAQDAKRDRQRKRRMKASKGSRYQKRYF